MEGEVRVYTHNPVTECNRDVTPVRLTDRLENETAAFAAFVYWNSTSAHP